MSKTFGTKQVLKDLTWDVHGGEVHGLVGPNGSGKSTLIKILAGYHQPDEGAQALYSGRSFTLGAIPAAQGAELHFVHQDLAIALELNAVDNIAMSGGYSKGRLGVIDWGEQRRLTERELATFGLQIDVTTPLWRLAPVERTAVAIVRALAGWDAHEGLLVLDEPTASLPADEVERLHDLVRQVSEHGAGVVYVSHRLDDVASVADRVTVLRDGRLVGTHSGDALTARNLAKSMIGSGVTTGRRPPIQLQERRRVLEVRELRGGRVADVSFDVDAGEIVGVAGVLGSGREDVPYLLSGSGVAPTAGTIRVDGRELKRHTPQAAQKLGVAFVPADRNREAVIPELTVSETLSLSVLDRLATSSGRVDPERERSHSRRWVEACGILPPDPETPMRTLSGGNQQKVVFARALALDPSVLVLAEPTAGVDVGARESLYELLRDEVESRGLSVIVASSDEGDLVSLCHRVLVLVDGSVAEVLTGDDITREAILHASENLPISSLG